MSGEATGGAVRDVEVDLGATHVDRQGANHEAAHDGGSAGEGLHVGGQGVDGRGAHLVSPVHQAEAASEQSGVEDHEEDERGDDVALDGHVRGDAGRDRHERQPEQGVTDAAQRGGSGNTHGADGLGIDLVLLEGENDTHNEGDQERVRVDEVQVVVHRRREVVLVGVNLLKTGDHGEQPATGLHGLVVERGLEPVGAPDHAVERLLIDVRRRSEILVLRGDDKLIRCHRSYHLRQKKRP